MCFVCSLSLSHSLGWLASCIPAKRSCRFLRGRFSTCVPGWVAGCLSPPPTYAQLATYSTTLSTILPLYPASPAASLTTNTLYYTTCRNSKRPAVSWPHKYLVPFMLRKVALYAPWTQSILSTNNAVLARHMEPLIKDMAKRSGLLSLANFFVIRELDVGYWIVLSTVLFARKVTEVLTSLRLDNECFRAEMLAFWGKEGWRSCDGWIWYCQGSFWGWACGL